MLTRHVPPIIEPGQQWGLWVYDDSLYEKFTIMTVASDHRVASGITENGNPCCVGFDRLLEYGDYLGMVE